MNTKIETMRTFVNYLFEALIDRSLLKQSKGISFPISKHRLRGWPFSM